MKNTTFVGVGIQRVTMNTLRNVTGNASIWTIPSVPVRSSGMWGLLRSKRKWSLLLMAFVGGFLLVNDASAGTINVFIPDASLQKDFIANTTNQYNGSLIPSPYFANTYSFNVTAKNPAYTPPKPSTKTIDAQTLFNTLVDISSSTYPYGFANGMDMERGQNIDLLYKMQGNDFAKKTCGGQTFTLPISTTSALNACLQTYNVIVSTISKRWDYVFTSTGGVASQ